MRLHPLNAPQLLGSLGVSWLEPCALLSLHGFARYSSGMLPRPSSTLKTCRIAMPLQKRACCEMFSPMAKALVSRSEAFSSEVTTQLFADRGGRNGHVQTRASWVE